MTIIRYACTMYQTFLFRANFDLLNAAYHDAANHDTCSTCYAAGGFITSEYQGDPPMGGTVDFFAACDTCLGSELCPGCMQPLALSFDLSAFEATTEWVAYNNPHYATNMGYLKRTFDYEDAISKLPFEGFTCLVCGWQYDPDRHNDHDDYYDDGDYDYPALDASDYFGGV